MPADEPWDAIARAVSARPDELRMAAGDVGAEANRFRHAAWPAWRPDVPYAVYLATPSGFRTLAFDIDRGGDAGAAQARRLTGLLRAAGVRFVEAVSGPAGHRHVITTWQTPVPPEAAAALAQHLRSGVTPDLDLSPLSNPRTGCIRPPGSPHRNGGRSRLHGMSTSTALQVLSHGNPRAVFDRLAALVAEPADTDRVGGPDRAQREPVRPGIVVRDAAGHPKLAGPRRPLGASTRSRLHRPLTPVEQADRSTAAYRVMVAAAFARWSLGDLWHLVDDDSIACFDHLRRARTADGFAPRRRHDVHARSERMWRAAVRYAAAQPPHAPGRPTTSPHVQAALEAITAAAARDRSSWTGQGGPGRRVVLEELLALAHRLESTTVARSVRDLELATGLGKSSVARALSGLRQRGWLVGQDDPWAESDRGQETGARLHRRAAAHQLRLPDDLRAFVGVAHAVVGGTLASAPQAAVAPDEAPGRPNARTAFRVSPRTFLLGAVARSHDACTRDGLGRHAGLLLDLLSADAVDTAQLADRACLRPRTVRRHLDRLAGLGLVRRGPGGVWVADLSGLAAAAEGLGVGGVVTQRQEQTRVERETWAFWLADFHAERGWATARGNRACGWQTTASGMGCPSARFPVDARGRRSWRAGTDAVRTGLGLTQEQLDRVDVEGQLALTAGSDRRTPTARSTIAQMAHVTPAHGRTSRERPGPSQSSPHPIGTPAGSPSDLASNGELAGPRSGPPQRQHHGGAARRSGQGARGRGALAANRRAS